jgi:hypothetical protein
MGEKIWGVMVEGFTDIVKLCADLITAPIIALCRVISDFIHGEGRYKHSDHDSRRAH